MRPVSVLASCCVEAALMAGPACIGGSFAARPFFFVAALAAYFMGHPPTLAGGTADECGTSAATAAAVPFVQMSMGPPPTLAGGSADECSTGAATAAAVPFLQKLMGPPRP